jgi:hypothetical protein
VDNKSFRNKQYFCFYLGNPSDPDFTAVNRRNSEKDEEFLSEKLPQKRYLFLCEDNDSNIALIIANTIENSLTLQTHLKDIFKLVL